MSNKENDFKEQFKLALISTAKVISEDYKIDFKKHYFQHPDFYLKKNNKKQQKRLLQKT